MSVLARPRQRRLRLPRLSLSSAALASLGAVLVAALFYLVAGYGYGKPFGEAGDPSYFIKAGTDFTSAELLPAGTFVNQGTGYDGQFFFYLAQDPLLLREDTVTHLDAPRYRYQRILLPALGWLLSGGEPSLLQWVLPLVNLLAVLGSGFLLARFLAARGLSPWLALVYMLSIGLVVGTLNDLSDPLAVGLFVAGVLCWIQGRPLPALIALTCAPLARELYIAPVLVIALVELARWRWRAWPWLLPLFVFASWNAGIRAAVAQSSAVEVASPSPVPLVGALEKLGELLREDVVGTANWELLFLVLALWIWGFLAWRSRSALVRLRRREWPSRAQLVAPVGLLSLWFVPFLSLPLWRNPLSYVRYAAAAAAVLLLIHALERDRWSLRLALGLLALSLVNPLVGLLPTHHGPVITPG